MFEGFDRDVLATPEGRVTFVRAGTGPPALLLHGFPQTHAAWHRVAPRLAQRFTVVVPDLPGYGKSEAPPPDETHERSSKRAAARVLAGVMETLGFDRFAVAGHDRGGRVAFRMALDHPARVSRLAVLDVVPTLDMAEGLTHDLALRMVNWFLLAQPSPFPETLLAQAPELYVSHILDTWAGRPDALAPEARAEYVRAFGDPGVRHAACEDYRAGATVDLEHDRADRAAGRTLRCPLLVLWSARGITGTGFEPLAVWKRWAGEVRGRPLDSGHFLMEEAPDAVAAELEAFLGQGKGAD